MNQPNKTYHDKRTVAVITARSGSKGIPRKNIKELLGKPLIWYTIEAAKNSQYLTRCLVSTDSEEIAAVAKDCGGDVPFLRPSELAHDSAPTIPVIQHALGWLEKNERKPYDYVMILQPTSPCRQAVDIDACIEKIVNTKADSVMSLVELSDFSLKKLKKISYDIILPLVEDEGRTSAARDKLEKVYKRNCAIYLTRVSCLIAGDLFGSVSRPYIMPVERSVDINTPADFAIAQYWLEKLRSYENS